MLKCTNKNTINAKCNRAKYNNKIKKYNVIIYQSNYIIMTRDKSRNFIREEKENNLEVEDTIKNINLKLDLMIES